MNRNRHDILSLVALGRITPCQAERLLIACNEGREGLWISACLALALLAFANSHHALPAFLHVARAWFEAGALHRSLALFAKFIGGSQ